MPDFAILRDRMVDRQIAGRGLTDPRLLQAFRDTPRELFVSDAQRQRAYEDCALPIKAGQTISQPFIVALTIAAARIERNDRVLEVGAGSGYAAAVLGRIAREVIAVERVPELVDLASGRLRQLGLDNVRIVHGDGSLGWAEAAPYDAILGAAAGPRIPRSWQRQLAPHGRIVMPLGPASGVQQLVRMTLDDAGRARVEELEPVRFVPLIGAEANSCD